MRLRLAPRLRLDIGWAALTQAAFGLPGANEARARSCIAAAFPGRSAVIGLSVRTLFDAVLTALAPKPGDVLVATAINIEGMAAIAAAHGLTLAVVDIDPETLAPPPGALAAACEAHAARLCLVAHLFGAVSPIADAKILKERGVIVVEDCAQAFAGDFYRGSPQADVSLFSFGPIKRATALGGAVALVADEALAARIGAVLAKHPPLSDLWYRRRAAKYLALKALSAPSVYRWVHAALRLAGRDPDAAIGAAARGFSGQDLLPAVRRRPPPRLLQVLAQRLPEHHDHATRAAAFATLNAGPLGQARPVGARVQRTAAWLAPVTSPDPARLQARLVAAGFDATRGATSLRALCPAAAPQADALMNAILYLPHPVDLSAQEQRALISALADRTVASPSSVHPHEHASRSCP